MALITVKKLAANAGDVRDVSSVPGLGESPTGGHGHPPQYSCQENPTDRGAWRAAVHGVPKSRIQLKRLSTHIADMGVTHTVFASLVFERLASPPSLIGTLKPPNPTRPCMEQKKHPSSHCGQGPFPARQRRYGRRQEVGRNTRTGGWKEIQDAHPTRRTWRNGLGRSKRTYVQL